MLLKMLDGGLLDIKEDEDYSEGCDTCDYGSCYTNYFDLKLTTMNIHLESSQMYEYPISTGNMMKALLPNIEVIKSLTEEEFSKWVVDELSSECSRPVDCKITKNNEGVN